uniref:BED-type domain-containing protein n=1 Tax=Brassica oleracea TaxID=3712 RepID=A0A3P6F4H6_BRAOL|nr:unnamed protein product [Brassica oleracea]
MTSQGSSDNIENASEEAPLWNYVTKLEKSGAKGSTWKFKCNICNKDRQGSYSRIRAHLLGIKNQGIAICKKVTRSQKAEMQKLEDEFEKKINECGSRAVPLPCESSETNPASKKRKSADSAIVRAFDSSSLVSGLMKEVINEVSHQNVVQIITDNAANCKAAGEIIEIADTRFASIIVMVKRLKLIKRGLEAMVISEEWSTYREADVGKATFVKGMILSDEWWEKVSYIIYFTRPIYEMIRFCDTDKPSLHLIYEMWDSMIEKVKYEIYKKEKRPLIEVSPFYKYEWLSEDSARLGQHRDPDVSSERMKCFRRLFPSTDDHLKVMDEYALFSMRTGPFKDLTCISVMFTMEPKKWWANFGAKFLSYRLWLLSCLDSLVHLMCSALRFLSRNSEQYEEEKTKMWDVGGDDFYSMEDVGYLEFANLSLDEPDLENRSIND